MGLTKGSAGAAAVDSGLHIQRQSPDDRVIAIAGNPNVGKSTVFNALTGMHQHTGNWPGKTVANAQGRCKTEANSYVLVDIPGTYSLMAHSAEEEVARSFLCLGSPDAIVVICDATCLERNLNLVLQIIEISNRVIVCVNLLDEARRKNIQIDLPTLSARLGVAVVGVVAHQKKTLERLTQALDHLVQQGDSPAPMKIRYLAPIEGAIALLEPVLREQVGEALPTRWLALRLLDPDAALLREMTEHLGVDLLEIPAVSEAVAKAMTLLLKNGIDQAELSDRIASCLVLAAEELCLDTVDYDRSRYNTFDRKLDAILTSRWSGYPIMLLLLAGVFWLTITGANYPSQLLSAAFMQGQAHLTALFFALGAPDWLHGMLVLGVWRTISWVIAVMLPPMAIFFPLFTLLEDSGYLPRIAYNLDRPFQRCNACGKQALTICMGFGCNAVGIVGCRIIDSPRERLIAILTNNFVPCNGRLPTLIVIIGMFFVGSAGGMRGSILSTLFLTGLILLGLAVTFVVSAVLSKTILRGVASSFTLELPPYRRPQVGRVIVRSMLDRTLFVLGRAVAVAAPAGLVLWMMANTMLGGVSLLSHCAGFLDPFARIIGLDGVILMAFLLGLPANEIVLPIILMGYLSQGSLVALDDSRALHTLLVQNGWTWVTALCTMLFSLMHWPCSTALLTIRKETDGLRWPVLACAIPTIIGMAFCFAVATVARLL